MITKKKLNKVPYKSPRASHSLRLLLRAACLPKALPTAWILWLASQQPWQNLPRSPAPSPADTGILAPHLPALPACWQTVVTRCPLCVLGEGGSGQLLCCFLF